MNKTIILALVSCMMFFTPVTSFATVQSFSRFSIDIPDGWEFYEDGNTVAVLAPEHVATLSIAVDDAGDQDALSVANAFSQQMNGTSPEPIDDGGYIFTFKTPAGLESTCLLYVEDNEFLLLSITGEHPDLMNVIDSIEEI